MHAAHPVALCITELDPGGAERAFVRLAMGLDRTEWAPAVFCLGPRGPLADELDAAGIPVTCYAARGVWQLPRVLRRLTRDLRALQPVLVQTWLFHANIVGRIAARRAGVSRIVSGIRVAERRGRWRLWLDRVTARRVDRHVCVSRAVADYSVQTAGLPAERVIVIPNGVDGERFATAPPADLTALGIPPHSPTVLFVGRLDPQKDPFLFLEMADRVHRVRDTVQFVIVGDGPLREELAAVIASLGLANRVHLTGRREDIPSLMRAATCLVLTSRWEGLPNVVLEAMGAGLPVISTDVEGVREAITHRETGLIVPPGDAGELAAAVLLVLNDPESASELAGHAQNHVLKCFTWYRFVRSHAELYRELTCEIPLRSPRFPC